MQYQISVVQVGFWHETNNRDYAIIWYTRIVFIRYVEVSSDSSLNKWDKVFKSGPNEIYGRQSLKFFEMI